MTEESVPPWKGVVALQEDREYIVKYQLKGHRRLRLMFADFLVTMSTQTFISLETAMMAKSTTSM